jgi:hypothetical protein
MADALPTNKEDEITYFAETDYRNQKKRFGIRAEDRKRHAYVIGKTGMGKSTLLENLAIQDIRSGNGLAFLDPHGKSAELLLDYVPEDRIDDVMYFAPFDLEHPISFNVMEDVGEDKRHLVANGLMSAFKKIWQDMWSARMEYLLNNALLALMEYPDSTLLGINRMYADEDYRERVVNSVSDVSVRLFWENEFAEYDERFMRRATAAIQNKIGQFVSNPLVRNIVGQTESSFDLREMMDSKKIILVNLSKGQVGEDNADLLGSMLITKMYLAAMSRSEASEKDLSQLPPFYFFVDEFQSFANESFADILSEARKYKLALTMAHQYIEQMSEDVKDAVFGNVGTMISFRVGAYDAEVLEQEFAPRFEAEDFVNLGFAQIYLKLMIDGVGSKPFSARTLPPIPRPNESHKQKIIERSREKYGRPRSEVEEQIREWTANPAGLIKSDAERAAENEDGETDKQSSEKGLEDLSPEDVASNKQTQEDESESESDTSQSQQDKQDTDTTGENNKQKDTKEDTDTKDKSKKDKSEDGLRDMLSSALSGTENEPSEFEQETEDESKKDESEDDDTTDDAEPKEDQSQESESSAESTKSEPQEIPQEELEKILQVEEEES